MVQPASITCVLLFLISFCCAHGNLSNNEFSTLGVSLTVDTLDVLTNEPSPFIKKVLDSVSVESDDKELIKFAVVVNIQGNGKAYLNIYIPKDANNLGAKYINTLTTKTDMSIQPSADSVDKEHVKFAVVFNIQGNGSALLNIYTPSGADAPSAANNVECQSVSLNSNEIRNGLTQNTTLDITELSQSTFETSNSDFKKTIFEQLVDEISEAIRLATEEFSSSDPKAVEMLGKIRNNLTACIADKEMDQLTKLIILDQHAIDGKIAIRTLKTLERPSYRMCYSLFRIYSFLLNLQQEAMESQLNIAWRAAFSWLLSRS